MDNIREHRQALMDFTDRHYLLMLIACGIGYSLSTALSLPGGTVLSLLLGFLFGRWMGTLLIVISATVGAAALFWMARYLLADWAGCSARHTVQKTSVRNISYQVGHSGVKAGSATTANTCFDVVAVMN